MNHFNDENTLCREHPDGVNLGTPDTVSTTSQKASLDQTLQPHHHLFCQIKLEPSSTTKNHLKLNIGGLREATLSYCFTVQFGFPSFAM